MNSSPGAHDLQFETLRPYLMMVGQAMIGHSYRGKIDTDEIVNYTLFEGYRQRHKFDGSTEVERAAWLRRVLADNIRDAIRYFHRERRDVDRELPLEWEDSQASAQLAQLTGGLTSPSAHVMREEQEMQLAQLLIRLPPDQRRAIEVHHLQGCTLEETAAEMNRSLPSVAGLLRRGLKQLREFLKEDGWDRK